jgi:hypothetical protein
MKIFGLMDRFFKWLGELPPPPSPCDHEWTSDGGAAASDWRPVGRRAKSIPRNVVLGNQVHIIPATRNFQTVPLPNILQR